MRTALLPCLALVLSSTAGAQAGVEYVAVVKSRVHEQIAAGQVRPATVEPNRFHVEVGGPPTLTPAPTIAGPITIGAAFHNGGVLGYNALEGAWGYGAPLFDGWNGPDQATLDGHFGSGTYDLTVSGVTVPVLLTGDLYPATPPSVSLTGGFWFGGLYVVQESQALGLNSSALPGFGTHAEDLVWLTVNGPGYGSEASSWAGQGGANAVSIQVPAGSLTAGASYFVEVGFVSASSFDVSIPGLPNHVAAGVYESTTELEVLVVPDGFGLQGTRYCTPATSNSTGSPAELYAGGSALVSDNALSLIALQVPQNQFGYFLVSANAAAIPNPGGSQGTLCLGLPIGRYNRPGELLFSGTDGALVLDLDLTDTPQASGPIAVQPGQTWNFTCWFRDVNPTNTSNFTDAVAVTFQ